MKDFFRRLFDPNISQGAKDYYAAMLFFDILCFLTIAAGVNSFGVSTNTSNKELKYIVLLDCLKLCSHYLLSSLQIGFQTSTIENLTAVADFVRNNNVPLLFVALLLLQFLSMVVDR